MSLLCENVPVALVFLTVAGFSWIFGGANAPMLMPVMPWLWALALETLLFFPQRHFGESFADARARVWKSLSRDPITYLTLAFLVVLLMPLFNCGLCKVCDYPKILAGADPAPPIPLRPFQDRRTRTVRDSCGKWRSGRIPALRRVSQPRRAVSWRAVSRRRKGPPSWRKSEECRIVSWSCTGKEVGPHKAPCGKNTQLNIDLKRENANAKRETWAKKAQKNAKTFEKESRMC